MRIFSLIALCAGLVAAQALPFPGLGMPASGGGGGSSITLVSFSAANASGVTSMTIAAPASITNGNLLIAGISHYSSTVTVTPPAGWSTACSQFNQNTNALVVFYKVASSESGNYVFSFSGTTYPSGSIANFSGTSGTPLDLCGIGNGGSSATATALSITIGAASEVVLYFSGTDGAVSPVGIPSGYATCGEEDGTGSHDGFSCGYIAQATAGATGNQTTSTGGPWTAVLVAIH